jgi:hypothetical protein
MRPRQVTILAAVFVVLLAAVVLERTPRGSGAAEVLALVPARPSQITRIMSMTVSDRVELRDDGGGWVVRDGDIAWPADAGRASAGLRLLASATVRRSAALALAELDASVEIEHEGGLVSLEFEAFALSGARAAKHSGRPVQIDGDIADVLAPASLRAWRDSAAMPGIGGGLRRISVRSSGATLELARVGSRWGLTEPIRTPADAGRVAELIGRLAGLQSLRQGSPVHPGDTAVEIEAESAGQTWVITSDAEGRGERLMRSEAVTYAAPLILSDEDLDALRIDAASLISPIVLAFPASDVRGVAVGESAIERDGRGWSRDAEEVEELLSLLVEVPCSAVSIGSPSASSRAVALSRFGDLPPHTLWIDVSEASLVVSDGEVTRRYERNDGDVERVARWLLGLGG